MHNYLFLNKNTSTYGNPRTWFSTLPGALQVVKASPKLTNSTYNPFMLSKLTTNIDKVLINNTLLLKESTTLFEFMDPCFIENV